jgi:hypothetical protein
VGAGGRFAWCPWSEGKKTEFAAGGGLDANIGIEYLSEPLPDEPEAQARLAAHLGAGELGFGLDQPLGGEGLRGTEFTGGGSVLFKGFGPTGAFSYSAADGLGFQGGAGGWPTNAEPAPRRGKKLGWDFHADYAFDWSDFCDLAGGVLCSYRTLSPPLLFMPLP